MPLRAAEVSPHPLVIESDAASHRFTVELATDDSSRRRGLMDRPSLAEDAGMLFVWPESRVIRMWMRNTVIPLDMLFLTREGRVMHIERDAQPGDLTPRGPSGEAVAVLEVVGGTAERLGIAIGDRVRHPALKAPAR